MLSNYKIRIYSPVPSLYPCSIGPLARHSCKGRSLREIRLQAWAESTLPFCWFCGKNSAVCGLPKGIWVVLFRVVWNEAGNKHFWRSNKRSISNYELKKKFVYWGQEDASNIKIKSLSGFNWLSVILSNGGGILFVHFLRVPICSWNPHTGGSCGAEIP